MARHPPVPNYHLFSPHYNFRIAYISGRYHRQCVNFSAVGNYLPHALFDSVGVHDMDIIHAAAPFARHGKTPSSRRGRRDRRAGSRNPALRRGCTASRRNTPSPRAGHERVPRAAEGRVAPADDELAVGIGFRLAYLYFIIFAARGTSIIKFSLRGFPRPEQPSAHAHGFGVAEYRAVLLRPG